MQGTFYFRSRANFSHRRMLGVKICSNLALQVWISGQSLYVKDGVWLCGHSMSQNTNVKHSSCRTINFFFNCYTHILYVIIKQFKSANGWFAIFLLHGTLKAHPKNVCCANHTKHFVPCEGLDLKTAVLMVRLWFHTQMHKMSHKCTAVEAQIKGFIHLLLFKLTTASGQVWCCFCNFTSGKSDRSGVVPKNNCWYLNC